MREYKKVSHSLLWPQTQNPSRGMYHPCLFRSLQVEPQESFPVRWSAHCSSSVVDGRTKVTSGILHLALNPQVLCPQGRSEGAWEQRGTGKDAISKYTGSMMLESRWQVDKHKEHQGRMAGPNKEHMTASSEKQPSFNQQVKGHLEITSTSCDLTESSNECIPKLSKKQLWNWLVNLA